MPGCNFYQGQPNYFSTIQNWDTAKGGPQFEITFSSRDCQSEKVWQLSASQTVLADNCHTFSIISFRGDTCHHTLCYSIHKRHLAVVSSDSCPTNRFTCQLFGKLRSGSCPLQNCKVLQLSALCPSVPVPEKLWQSVLWQLSPLTVVPSDRKALTVVS